MSNQQTILFTFFIFTKVRPVQSKVTEIDTHTYTEIDRPIAISEIVQICLKIEYLFKK